MAKKKKVVKKTKAKSKKKSSAKKVGRKKIAKKVVSKKKVKKKTSKKTASKKISKKAKKKKVKAKKTKKKSSVKKTPKKMAKKVATKKKTVRKKKSATAQKKVSKKKTSAKKVSKKANSQKASKLSSRKTTSSRAKKKSTPLSQGAKMTTEASQVELKVYEPQVTIGQKVPNFSLPATGESEVSLSSLAGKKAVIFFYPKDATPGCTIEAHDFTRLEKDFNQLNASVFGVSRDNMKSHERFKEKQSYSIDLISDVDEKLCSIFGAIRLKNMYGKKVRGIDRSTFVIDESGKLLKEWRKVKVDGHADEVLAYLKSL